MIFLTLVLGLTTLLLCYAGYVFLIVDKRSEKQVLENPELFDALDDKCYDFVLPDEVEEYEELRASMPTDKRTLPQKLLERAKADIPRIEQLERDHPRMARLFNKGLLPFSIWEQLMDAEAQMDTEVHSVQAEAEKLQKGWGAGVFSQAYQMLRRDREDDLRRQQEQRDAAQLTLEFTKLSGGVVTLQATGTKVATQSNMKIKRECLDAEVAFKTTVKCELSTGAGDDKRTFRCVKDPLELDTEKEAQWAQIGVDSTALRLQVKFVRKNRGFTVSDIRATIPAVAVPGSSPTKAVAAASGSGTTPAVSPTKAAF